MSTAFEQRQRLSPPAIQTSLPHVIVTGDLQLSVTESEAAHGSVKGSYSIETQEMQEPLLILWGGEGQVLDRRARITDIVFEMPEARAGQRWIYPVQAQVTDRWTSIVTGVFVQIFVIPDTPLQVTS